MLQEHGKIFSKRYKIKSVLRLWLYLYIHTYSRVDKFQFSGKRYSARVSINS